MDALSRILSLSILYPRYAFPTRAYRKVTEIELPKSATQSSLTKQALILFILGDTTSTAAASGLSAMR